MATHYCSRACQVEHWSKHKIPLQGVPDVQEEDQKVAALYRLCFLFSRSVSCGRICTVLTHVASVAPVLRDNGSGGGTDMNT